MRFTFENDGTTVTTVLDDEATIDDVIEAVDYALRGGGWEPAVIHRGFGRYGTTGEDE